jgi:uncharacterized RDD family membrane protein YckC
VPVCAASVPVRNTDPVTPGLPALTPPAAPASALSDHGQTRIVTGEAVHLDVRVARLGSRALARIIDAVIQLVLYILLLFVLSIGAGILSNMGVIAFDVAVLTSITIGALVVAMLGYPVLLETTTRGRTLGKLVLGLRVVRDDGGPVTFRHAVTRGLVGFAVEWPGILAAPLTWLATIWTMIASPQSKRIGDHVAGTIVIHERTPAAWGWAPTMPPELALWAATLDLTGLDDDLALGVRNFLARNRSIREPARTELGLRLAREVAAVTNPPPPPGTPGWKYLAAVHAERHRRAMRQLAAVRARAATVWPDLAAVTAAPALAWPARSPASVGTSPRSGSASVGAGSVPSVRPMAPDA